MELAASPMSKQCAVNRGSSGLQIRWPESPSGTTSESRMIHPGSKQRSLYSAMP